MPETGLNHVGSTPAVRGSPDLRTMRRTPTCPTSRWSRYDKKRVYVRPSYGTEVGHVDLVTGAVVATVDACADELAAVAVSTFGVPAALSTDLITSTCRVSITTLAETRYRNRYVQESCGLMGTR